MRRQSALPGFVNPDLINACDKGELPAINLLLIVAGLQDALRASAKREDDLKEQLADRDRQIAELRQDLITETHKKDVLGAPVIYSLYFLAGICELSVTLATAAKNNTVSFLSRMSVFNGHISWKHAHRAQQRAENTDALNPATNVPRH